MQQDGFGPSYPQPQQQQYQTQQMTQMQTSGQGHPASAYGPQSPMSSPGLMAEKAGFQGQAYDGQSQGNGQDQLSPNIGGQSPMSPPTSWNATYEMDNQPSSTGSPGILGGHHDTIHEAPGLEVQR
jgi:hypothetical protein